MHTKTRLTITVVAVLAGLLYVDPLGAARQTASTPSTSVNPPVIGCATTSARLDKPAERSIAAFADTWYGSEDDRLWAGQVGRWFAGSNKVLWAKPKGESLDVRAQRIDGVAPDGGLDDTNADDYLADGYQASILEFSTPGCWNITANSGDSTLQMVVYVYPRTFGPTVGGCADLETTLEATDEIVVGMVESSTSSGVPGFTWQTIQPESGWRGQIDGNERLEVLQQLEVDETLRPGTRYLMFLQSSPGRPWQIFCPQRTLFEVNGDDLVPTTSHQESNPLWQEASIEALRLRTLS